MIRPYDKLRLTALFLCAFFLLFSCGGKTVKTGIDITDTKPVFSEETERKSKELFYTLLEGAYISGGMPNVTEQKAEEFREYAEQIWVATTDYHISEARYKCIIGEVSENKDKFISLLSGAAQDKDALREVYYSLTAGGSDYAGYTLYNLILLGMEISYSQSMERYEKYGYGYLLDEAERISEMRRVLLEQIGANNFSSVVRLGITASELFFGGAFDGTGAVDFSSREILVILQRVDVESINISENGYRFLLSLLTPDSSAEGLSLSERILVRADENGDLDKFAALADDFLKLVISVQAELTDADAEMLKNEKMSELVLSIFSKFEDGDWQIFEEIFSTDISYGDYEAVFLEEYGEDFENYSSSSFEVTLDELKASVGSDKFITELEGYLGGVSPVLSYRLFK
ncbi:MAG: hypothetical protein E7612_05445 [Ruminococcaceae bacterium]|nr:hypothetical protein [Oscillospiraceae bacterium]